MEGTHGNGDIEMMPSRIPREQIPWYPRVALTKCTGDQACVKFCPHSVYHWDPDTKQPMVADPYSCVMGCSKCTSICEPGAISFPTLEWLGEFLEKLREGTCGCS